MTELYSGSDYPGAPDILNPRDLVIIDDTIVWTDTVTDQILSAPLSGNGPVSVLYDIDDLPGSPTSSTPYFITAVVVPEPSSFALLGLSSIGIVGRRRKRTA